MKYSIVNGRHRLPKCVTEITPEVHFVEGKWPTAEMVIREEQLRQARENKKKGEP